MQMMASSLSIVLAHSGQRLDKSVVVMPYALPSFSSSSSPPGLGEAFWAGASGLAVTALGALAGAVLAGAALVGAALAGAALLWGALTTKTCSQPLQRI